MTVRSLAVLRSGSVALPASLRLMLKTRPSLLYSNRFTCTGDDSQFFFADDGNWLSMML